MSQYPNKHALVSLLSGVSLFQNADNYILQQLAGKIIFTAYNAGETIIRKGEVGQTMYIIISGKLKVHDDEHQVAVLDSGDFFGELSILDSEPRSMSVSAIDDAVLGSIDRKSFYEVLTEFPDITKDIIAVLNKRLRGQNDLIVKEFKTREDQLKELVKIRTLELEEKNKELEHAMVNLKKSQQQLIQSEKLASLGQMSAGIAHEIQNPLNFVNNFSQFSVVLVDEILASKTDEDRLEIGNDLRTNLEKIFHHGKRADSIVRNMLEHSRTSAGERQLTDMNALCDEYFNLTYQGMRGNDPNFNCSIERELDPNLQKIELVSQEISRVLVNIFNNAFYAVRNRTGAKVSLKTTNQNGQLLILVKDNGIGIADSILEKIFEPFFTTKPTGEGTGLGLSLSYDIIKSNGGEIKVESKEGFGTTFIISLPAL